jgi:hypothetical protein
MDNNFVAEQLQKVAFLLFQIHSFAFMIVKCWADYFVHGTIGLTTEYR